MNARAQVRRDAGAGVRQHRGAHRGADAAGRARAHHRAPQQDRREPFQELEIPLLQGITPLPYNWHLVMNKLM